jgi:hypothetical protein
MAPPDDNLLPLMFVCGERYKKCAVTEKPLLKNSHIHPQRLVALGKYT